MLFKKRKNKIILFVISFITCFFVLGSNSVQAAVLHLYSSASTITSGNTATIRTSVDTSGVAINNADATIRFPTDLIEVVSVSKGGSIFSLWVEEPSFSNSAGTISFNGGVPTPGFTGSGNIISVTVRAKQAGQAAFTFSGAAVRANDGYGTNVLSGQSGTTITIIPKVQNTAAPNPTAVTVSSPTPTLTPTITSPTPTPSAPMLGSIPARVPIGEPLLVRGTTQSPGTDVTVNVKYNDEEAVLIKTKSNSDGDFFIFTSPLKEGNYQIWAQIGLGDQAVVSEHFSTTAANDSSIKIGSYTVTPLDLIIAVSTPFLILLLVSFYLGYRSGRIRRIRETTTAILDPDYVKILLLLKKQLERHLATIQSIRQKRVLLPEEKNIKEEIENDLDDVDRQLS